MTPDDNQMALDETQAQSDFGAVVAIEICFLREEEGGFSAFVPSLPGVGSQGENKIEAFENCKDALRAALAAYEADGRSVPWKEDPWKDHPDALNPAISSAWVQLSDVERAA